MKIRTYAIALTMLSTSCKMRGDSAEAEDQTKAAATLTDKEADREQAIHAARSSGALGSTAMGSGAAAAPAADKPAKAPAQERRDESGKNEAHKDLDALDEKMADGKFASIGGGKATESTTRTWFPETFLFEPLVVTDPKGRATLDVRVPDRLTTWHVLALGHTRGGAQAGATTSFLGTLPAYVDPIVPKRMLVGDDIRLPIQLVNTTDAAITGNLEMGARNATLVGKGGSRTIPAAGSTVEYVGFHADHPGVAKLHVGLGSSDAIERNVEVTPTGRPVTIHKGGTLAGPRSLTIEGPANADPATSHARLRAYPGALSLLRSELGTVAGRASVADDAYALLLAGTAPKLLLALHDTPDTAALRELSILTSQRAVRDARTLDVDGAALLTEAALAHPDNPVMQRLGERAAAFLTDHQRPDGTFAGGDGWTLQRVLVATADATRAVATATTTPAGKQRSQAVSVKAEAVFERTHDHVDDGYTAAAILATGTVKGAIADKLRTRVRDSLKKTVDGARYLDVPSDGSVLRADGRIPSTTEATALVVFALAGDPDRADLGATLLAAYTPDGGWGDGRANLECMRAVLELFSTPMPADVAITLTMDGRPVANGTLSRERMKDVLTLDAPTAISGSHTWGVVATPAVPGLGFSLELQGYVPWEHESAHGGLELALPATMTANVGKPTDISITAIAPSQTELTIVHALPAGVQVDRPSLEALVSAGTISRFETPDGAVKMYVAGLQPGSTFAAKYRVIPTLAGTLHAAASSITASNETFHVPPVAWTIR